MLERIRKFKVRGLKIISVGLIASCVSPLNASDFESSPATIGNRAPILGGAHNSQLFENLPTRCVNGYESDVSYNLTTTSDLIFDQAYENFKSDLKIDGEFEYSFADAFSAELQYSWATNLKDTNTSISLLYKTRTQGLYSQWTLEPIEGSFLTETGKIALESDDTGYQFYLSCGNSFVDSLALGGALYVALIIDFRTEYMKEHFESTAKANFTTVSGVFEMKNVINYTKEKYGESASLRLTALQIGGSSTQVGNLLSLAGGSSSDCLRNESTKLECFNIIDALQEYVAGEFALSLEESPTVLDYNYAPYTYIPEVGYEFKPIPQEIIEKRKQISQAFLSQYELKTEWEGRLKNMEKLGPALQQRLSTSKSEAEAELVVVSSNIQNLKLAQEVCFSPTVDLVINECGTTADFALENQVDTNFPSFPHAVYPFGHKNMTSKAGLEMECRIPELSVLTGVDMRIKSSNVKGLTCWYRKLNEDGTLGAQYARVVGSGSEAPIVVPNGYVVTGYGFRSKDNNAKTAIVYYRKWDAESKSLIGPTLSKRGGASPNGGLELQFNPEYDYVRGLNADTGHTMLTGIGASVTGDNASALRLYLGWIE